MEARGLRVRVPPRALARGLEAMVTGVQGLHRTFAMTTHRLTFARPRPLTRTGTFHTHKLWCKARVDFSETMARVRARHARLTHTPAARKLIYPTALTHCALSCVFYASEKLWHSRLGKLAAGGLWQSEAWRVRAARRSLSATRFRLERSRSRSLFGSRWLSFAVHVAHRSYLVGSACTGGSMQHVTACICVSTHALARFTCATWHGVRGLARSGMCTRRGLSGGIL